MPSPAVSGREPPKYSTFTGFIFLFNLIVGTGALALPGALLKSGVFVGVALLLVLAVFSLITVTFILEALAAANALSRKRYQDQGERNPDSAEATPLVQGQRYQESDAFEITEKYELGQMGVLMTPKWSQVLIYFCLCVYLYGDIAIYEAVVGRTGTFILCTTKTNNSADYTSSTIPCWKTHSLTRKEIYYIITTCFVFLLGPFVFFNLHKTIGLQILTVVMRWLAFIIIVSWNLYRLCTIGVQGHPPTIDINAVPSLFGTLVYSFMCQHSIPGLLQPISNKKHLQIIIAVDYIVVACFYLLLSVTAVYSFEVVQDIFSLNFWELTADSDKIDFPKILAYYLAFFPIFTLSTSFPIISITLKNNLRSMIVKNAPPTWYYDRLIFPLLTLIPPTVLAILVNDLHLLVGVVGSYAGAGIQYMIPCILVQYGRKQTQGFTGRNKYASHFKGKLWPYAVYTWMLISLIFITINYATTL